MEWEEKRQHKRAYIRFMVECRGKSSWQMIEATDISAGGMFVATDTIEPPNTELEILFEFGSGEGDKRFVRAEGVVVWTRTKEAKDSDGSSQPSGMGIRFKKLNPLSAKEFINGIVKKMEELGDA